MQPVLISPATALLLGIPAKIFFILIPLIGIGVFAYIMKRRIEPLLKAAPDQRFNRYAERVRAVLKIWLAQWRHPRYLLAGVLHIIVFFGFLTLAARSTQLVILGFVDGFTQGGVIEQYVVLNPSDQNADVQPIWITPFHLTIGSSVSARSE